MANRNQLYAYQWDGCNIDDGNNDMYIDDIVIASSMGCFTKWNEFGTIFIGRYDRICRFVSERINIHEVDDIYVYTE